MHPDILQSLAAERVRDMRQRLTEQRRGVMARRARSTAAAVTRTGRGRARS
jgi:hypothetical protein